MNPIEAVNTALRSEERRVGECIENTKSVESKENCIHSNNTTALTSMSTMMVK